MTWQSCVPAVTACTVNGKSSAAEVVDLSANQVTESVGWTQRHFGTLKFRWFVLWWAHLFMWLCLRWADPNKQMRDKTVIRDFTHKQTQKWCRFTLFSTWTTNRLNLHVWTSSRARKRHSKFKSFVKLFFCLNWCFKYRLHFYYSSGLITFLLNFILEKSFSPWFHACTLYMHEVYFKAWPFLSSFTCCDRTYIFFNSPEGQRVLSIRPVNRHIKTQLIKFCWKSGVVLLQLFDYNNKHRAHSSLYKHDSLPAHIPLALIDADHLNGIIDTLGNFLVVFTVLCSFPCKSLHVLSFWSVLCSFS